MQAERELQKGYIYKPDSYDQMAFEQEFGFTETKDQLDAINEVKKDMEGKVNERIIKSF